MFRNPKHKMQMDKCKRKKQNSYNPVAVKALSEKYSLTPYYIRQCLRGDRKSLTSDTIYKEYKKLVSKIETLVEIQKAEI